MKNSILTLSDNEIFDTMNEDNNSVYERSPENTDDEGQYSIVRNEVRSTWPKRRPKYQKLRDNQLKDSHLTVFDQCDDNDNDSQSHLHSPLNGSISDIICRDVDNNINDIQANLESINQLFENVNSDRKDQNGLSYRLTEDNLNLQQKIKALELQYNKTDIEARDQLELLRLRHSNEFKKMMSQKNEEIEEFRNKLSNYEKNLTNQRISRVACKNEVDNAQYELERLSDKIKNNNQQFSMIEDEFERLKEITSREIKLERKERDEVKQQYDIVVQALDTHQRRAIGLSKASGHLDDMMNAVRDKTQTNRQLQQQLEELQAELLAKSVVEARNIIHDNTSCFGDETTGVSWAAETNQFTKSENSELIELIIKEKEANEKLRQYSDKLISRIIEVDASILEI